MIFRLFEYYSDDVLLPGIAEFEAPDLKLRLCHTSFYLKGVSNFVCGIDCIYVYKNKSVRKYIFDDDLIMSWSIKLPSGEMKLVDGNLFIGDYCLNLDNFKIVKIKNHQHFYLQNDRLEYSFDREVLDVSPNKTYILLSNLEVISLHQEYVTFPDQELFYISGPINLIYLEKNNRKFYLFGDKHFSYQGVCFGSSLAQTLDKWRPNALILVEDNLKYTDISEEMPINDFRRYSRGNNFIPVDFRYAKRPNNHWFDLASQEIDQNYPGEQIIDYFSSGKMMKFIIKKLRQADRNDDEDLLLSRIDRIKDINKCIKIISNSIIENEDDPEDKIRFHQFFFLYSGLMDLGVMGLVDDCRYDIVAYLGYNHTRNLAKYLMSKGYSWKVYGQNINERCIYIPEGINKISLK